MSKSLSPKYYQENKEKLQKKKKKKKKKRKKTLMKDINISKKYNKNRIKTIYKNRLRKL